MLRFDLPRLPANVVRWEAFVTFALCVAAWLITPWLMVIPAVQGVIKGFFGHTKCPGHAMWSRLFTARGWQGKLEDAGAKMFAAKILAIASCVALVLLLSGSTLWRVPVGALIVFSTLEWALSFCAACWVYGAWYRRFPPAGT